MRQTVNFTDWFSLLLSWLLLLLFLSRTWLNNKNNLLVCFLKWISIGVLKVWISGLCFVYCGSYFTHYILKLTNNQTLDSLLKKPFVSFLSLNEKNTNKNFRILGQNFSRKYNFVIIFVVLIFTSKSNLRQHSLKVHNWLLSTCATWLRKGLDSLV